MAEPRGFGPQARLERLVARLATAINTRALYSPGHPHLAPAIGLVVDAVVTACEERKEDSVTLLRFGDELVFGDRPLYKGGLHQQPVIRALKRRNIERLTLGAELDVAECHRLVEALAVGGVPETTAHVVLGQLEVDVPEAREGESLEGVMSNQLDEAMETFLEFRSDRRAGLVKLEGMVWSFMDALSRSTRTVLRVAPLKSYDEYTFVHSVNVSLLVLAQARSFGLQGSLLHSIGLAALVHDVGKLSIPIDILNKPGRLDAAEWKTMMLHAELGAWQLAELDLSNPLALLVAYEHHLRFDGQPNYPALKTQRRPTLASQLTAVADVYDAICTSRPYRPALTRQAALDVLRERAGTFHDPFLLGNFFRLLGAE